MSHISRAALPVTRWQDQANSEGIPYRMLCPVSREIMHDPVVASDGNTYDRPSLKRILAESFEPASPLTGEPLTHTYLPNGQLQREIVAFVQANADLQIPLEPQQQAALSMAIAQGVASHVARASLLQATVLPDSPADVQLQYVLEDVGHRPPRLSRGQATYDIPGLAAPTARSRRAGRLTTTQMQREAPVYNPQHTPPEGVLGEAPAGRLNQADVRLRYGIALRTPERTTAAQLGTLSPVTRLWSSSSSAGSATSPYHRGTAVGSLAGGVATSPPSPTGRLGPANAQSVLDLWVLATEAIGRAPH